MRILVAASLMSLLGCGEDVTGHWCGLRVSKDSECVGDETGMLLVNQEGDKIDGQACEAHLHDCHILEKGRVSGNQIDFHYSFRDGYVDATLSIEGDVMHGRFYASKCKCDISRTFYRIP